MPIDWVARFEEELLPSLRRIAEEIRQAFPKVTANVYSSPVGSLTSLQGHNLSVSCLLQDASPDMSDLVDLCIDLAYLTSHPQLTGADVCWGHPSGFIEVELISETLDLSDAVARPREGRAAGA